MTTRDKMLEEKLHPAMPETRLYASGDRETRGATSTARTPELPWATLVDR